MSAYFAATADQTISQRVIFVSMAAGFLWIAWFGSRLLPYVFAQVTADAEGLEILRGGEQLRFPWRALGHAVNYPTMQVLDIYSRDGNRVLSIDYFMTGYFAIEQIVSDNVEVRP